MLLFNSHQTLGEDGTLVFEYLLISAYLALNAFGNRGPAINSHWRMFQPVRRTIWVRTNICALCAHTDTFTLPCTALDSLNRFTNQGRSQQHSFTAAVFYIIHFINYLSWIWVRRRWPHLATLEPTEGSLCVELWWINSMFPQMYINNSHC